MELNRHALRALRERTGLTVTELARLSGTTHSHISNIETGARKASPKLIKCLAAALKVDAHAITYPAPGAAVHSNT
jgi:transcriptional regulator with XRE-family HTH domain